MNIYLTGPLLNNGVESRSQMQLALNLIPDSFRKNSPLCLDESQVSTDLNSYIKDRLNILLECETVVTMDHIELDPIAALEISVARTANMKVVPFWKFIRDAK